MKSKLFLFILGLLLTGILVGCEKEEVREKQLEDLGILGEHKLRRIEQTSGISGHVGGSFILGIGSFSGNLSSQRKLQFYWGRTADELVSTTLPYNMFRFVINETKEIPTVEFIFDEKWLNSKRVLYTETEKSNLNWWLSDDIVRARKLRVAVVAISRKDLEKEIYATK